MGLRWVGVVTLIATLGFDEKFTVRALMRHAGRFKKLYVVTAHPLEERAEKALSTVREFALRYIGGVELRTVTVDPQKPAEAVAEIKKKIFLQDLASEYIINISGGMRALVFELVLAAVLSRIKGVFEIELENFKGLVTVPVEYFMIQPLSTEEYKIVKVLVSMGQATAEELRAHTGIPRSTLYRYLKELVNRGVVNVEKVNKKSVYKPSSTAYILL